MKLPFSNRSNESDTVHPRYKRQHQQHEAGWRVMLDDECIAELGYLHDDQPFHLFRARLFTNDPTKLDYAFQHVAKREPGTRLQFHNRRTGEVAADEHFISRLHADGTVSVRDFRAPDELDKRNA
jgi:hypothetical protein